MASSVSTAAVAPASEPGDVAVPLTDRKKLETETPATLVTPVKEEPNTTSVQEEEAASPGAKDAGAEPAKAAAGCCVIS